MEKFIIKWVKIISGQIINLHKTKSKILVLASILNVYNLKKRKNKRQKRKLDKQERNNDLQIHQIITNVMLFKYSAK